MAWLQSRYLFLTAFSVGSVVTTTSAILGHLSRTSSFFGAPLGFELLLFGAISAFAIFALLTKSTRLSTVLHHLSLISLIAVLFYFYSISQFDYRLGAGSRPLHILAETAEKMAFYAYWRDLLQLVGLCLMGLSYIFVITQRPSDHRPADRLEGTGEVTSNDT